MALSTQEKISGVGIITILGLVLAFSGEARGWLSFLHPQTPESSSSSSTQVKHADLTFKRGDESKFSENPLIYLDILIFENIGDGNAKDVILFCGILESNLGSRAALPPIEAHGRKEIPIYLPRIKGDILHEHDASYCPDEPVISYTDDSGKHRVYFDSTGQAHEQ